MAKKKANKQLIYVVMAALFAAIITVVTAYVLRIPTGNGYIHLGDSFIFLAASLLPLPYAIAAAAVGADRAYMGHCNCDNKVAHCFAVHFKERQDNQRTQSHRAYPRAYSHLRRLLSR